MFVSSRNTSRQLWSSSRSNTSAIFEIGCGSTVSDFSVNERSTETKKKSNAPSESPEDAPRAEDPAVFLDPNYRAGAQCETMANIAWAAHRIGSDPRAKSDGVGPQRR